jgi:hypothetical protein
MSELYQTLKSNIQFAWTYKNDAIIKDLLKDIEENKDKLTQDQISDLTNDLGWVETKPMEIENITQQVIACDLSDPTCESCSA